MTRSGPGDAEQVAMSIELHCDHCGQRIRAPAEAGGRWGDCPQCGQKVYIPTPADEREEIPLAPVDEAEERRARRQRETDIAVENQLQRGGPVSNASPARRPPAEPDPPADEGEEIPLAPVDETEERRARRQRETDMAFETQLQRGGPVGGASPARRRPAEPDPPADPSDLTGQLIRYVRGMADGRMAECDGIVAGLVGRRQEVAETIGRLTAQTPLPSALAGMPPAVVKGYLKQLLGQL